jgi:hypothetical protein
MLNFKLTSKTIVGGILLMIAKVIESGALGIDVNSALQHVAQIVEGVGYFVGLWGIWHGQQKLKATVVTGVDPEAATVSNAPRVRV